jgi:hypothetical protein
MVPRPRPAVNIEASVQMFSIANVTLRDLDQISGQLATGDNSVDRIDLSLAIRFLLCCNLSVAKR